MDSFFNEDLNIYVFYKESEFDFFLMDLLFGKKNIFSKKRFYGILCLSFVLCFHSPDVNFASNPTSSISKVTPKRRAKNFFDVNKRFIDVFLSSNNKIPFASTFMKTPIHSKYKKFNITNNNLLTFYS